LTISEKLIVYTEANWRITTRMLNTEKQRWAEEHARRIELKFEQWQEPLDIDGTEYVRYLADDLLECFDEPLMKSLIESICSPWHKN